MPFNSDDTLTDILESMADAFMSVDSEWRLTYVNGKAEALLRAERAAMLSRPIWDVTPFRLGTRFEAAMRRAIATRAEVQVEAYSTPDDTWFEMRALPYGGDLALYFVDVSARKRAEEALAERQLRLEQALEAGEMGAWQFDLDSRLLETTVMFRAAFGHGADTEPSLPELYYQVHPDDRERVYAIVSRAVEQHMPFRVQYRAKWPDSSEHWLATHGQLVYDVNLGRRQVVGVTFDITNRKALASERERLLRDAQIAQGVAENAQEYAEVAQANTEAALERAEKAQREAEHAREQAESASRLKDEFLATLSHELRTPLMAIIGWADMLAQGVLDTEQSENAGEVILRNAKNQAQLIEDIIDLSRVITGQMRLQASPVDLGRIVCATASSLEPTAHSRGVALRVQVEDNECAMYGDPKFLQQIVWNLLSNAVKFTPRHGEVTIALQCCAPDSIITVQDTGRGIAPDVLPFIFDRFRQGDSSSTRAFGGLGIGLSLVRHLAELHGGTVEAHSAGLNQGATFIVTLPCVKPRDDSNASSL